MSTAISGTSLIPPGTALSSDVMRSRAVNEYSVNPRIRSSARNEKITIAAGTRICRSAIISFMLTEHPINAPAATCAINFAVNGISAIPVVSDKATVPHTAPISIPPGTFILKNKSATINPAQKVTQMFSIKSPSQAAHNVENNERRITKRRSLHYIPISLRTDVPRSREVSYARSFQPVLLRNSCRTQLSASSSSLSRSTPCHSWV